MKTIFALVLLALASMAVAQTPAPKALHVEVLLYSGRPNPTFTITDPAEIRDILAAATALPSAAAEAVPAPAKKLGYRGFAVENLSGIQPDIKGLQVHRQTVMIARDRPQRGKTQLEARALPESQRHVDTPTTLEARLLAAAQAHGAVDEKLAGQIRSGK